MKKTLSPSLNSIDEDDEWKDYQGDEGYERRSPNLLQFTHSISAINSMSLGVQVLKAKKAFLKALAVRHLTAEDYRRQGEARWKDISSDYQPSSLLLADLDFSSLSERMKKSPAPPVPSPTTNSNSLQGKTNSDQRMIPFHWRPILAPPRASSVWADLPKVTFNKEELSELFKYKESAGRKSSVTPQRKPKTLTILDPKRSNQINIALTSLPSVSSIRDIIMDMKDDLITRDGIEKLQALLPTEEEIISIREICEPYKHLMTGIRIVRESKTFERILAMTLAVGNEMNRSEVKCFDIDSLLKLSSIKDSSHKKNLLHFITSSLLDAGKLESLTELLHSFSHVTKTDYDEVEANLVLMEDQCKNALGYLSLAANYDRTTKKLVEEFLIQAVKEMVAIRIVIELVNDLFDELVEWLGVPPSRHKEYTPARVGFILSKFARELEETRLQIEREKENERKVRRIKIRRAQSMIEVDSSPRVNGARIASLSNGRANNGSHDTEFNHLGKANISTNEDAGDDLESVLNKDHTFNQMTRKYINRRRSLSTTIKL